MESMFGSMKAKGETLYNSSSLRLEKRPSTLASDRRSGSQPAVDYGGLKGKGMGSAWGNAQKPESSTTKGKGTGAKNLSKKPTRKTVVQSSEESAEEPAVDTSDDEFDSMLSSQAGSDDASRVTRVKPKPKAKPLEPAPEPGFMHNGQFIPHQPRENFLAKMKFKKIKSSESNSSQPTPSSSVPSTSQSRTTASKESSPPQRCGSPPTPVPKAKPRPRPITKAKAPSNSVKAVGSSSKVVSDAISVDEDERRSLVPKPVAKRKPAAFPMSLPSAPSSPSSTSLPKDFPSFSPFSKSKVHDNGPRKPEPFAFPSPLSKDKGKAKANALSDDDGSDSENVITSLKKKKGKDKGRKPAPFPMSTQALSDIGDIPRRRSAKRLSPDYSDEDRDSKKTKRDVDDFLHDNIHDFVDEGDSILIAPTVDPKTLCPYCDTPLPSSPSPLLIRLLATVKKKSSRDPRPANPLGRTAPLGVFIVLCQRHQFESQILPEAELKGWPKSIDWSHLGSRIRRMKQHLQALINDSDASKTDDDWDVVYSKSKKTVRSKCIFWQEIVEDVKKKGSRSVTGVQGQFANFEKAQPGYYGELGSAIIQQTLYDLFPPDSVDPAVFTPLTANEFVQRVLVPEVAVRLIMDDQFLDGDEGMQKAIIILRESSAYGAAMFPDDSADAGKKKAEDGLAASEQIVFERAMKRRKELEEEDLREEQARKEEEEAMITSEKEKEQKPRRQRTTRARESDAQDSDAPIIPTKPKPRPRPVAKPFPGGFNANPSLESLPSGTRSRSGIGAASTDVEVHGLETSAEMSSSDSDMHPIPQPTNSHRASSEERRRSPSVSEMPPVYPPKPNPAHSTKARLASLSLSDNSESEKRSYSITSRKTRTSSRSLVSKSAQKTKSSASSDMVIDSDDSEPEIMKMDNTKTPKPKPQAKQASSLFVNDDTPKPAKKALDKSSDLPLLRARARMKTDGRSQASIAGTSDV
ncbi:hypothetical protein CVT24_001868 [Panaeolus cyanescens]|uniref:Restriction of telomere capping protein 4 n=1 Tax=Panaeolus cyanescens TaxID=181874 RepID=A0A409YEQ5_9AGAR|nr:hypothetical protein CVT24_001868 [Panaeolus cyanescens]